MLTPYDIIKESVHFTLCSTLAKGAVFVIVFAWYDAHCPDLGLNPNYARIAGMRSHDWDHHKDRITPVLVEVMPRILELHKKRIARVEKNARNATHARAVKQQRYKEKRQTEVFRDDDSGHTAVQPILLSEKKWNSGQSDLTSVKRVKAAKPMQLTGVTFKDK